MPWCGSALGLARPCLLPQHDGAVPEPEPGAAQSCSEPCSTMLPANCCRGELYCLPFGFIAGFLLCPCGMSQTGTLVKSTEFWSMVSGLDQAEARTEFYRPSLCSSLAFQALCTQGLPRLRCAQVSAVVLTAFLSFLLFSLPFVTNCFLGLCTGRSRRLFRCVCASRAPSHRCTGEDILPVPFCTVSRAVMRSHCSCD